MFILGSEMRDIYINNKQFLGDHYDNEELRVRSTYFNRSVRSANYFLQGLYPTSTGPDLKPNYDP